MYGWFCIIPSGNYGGSDGTSYIKRHIRTVIVREQAIKNPRIVAAVVNALRVSCCSYVM